MTERDSERQEGARKADNRFTPASNLSNQKNSWLYDSI
jgi:hypothetical protein